MFRSKVVAMAAAMAALAGTMGEARAASLLGGRCGGVAGLRCSPWLTCRITAPGVDRMGTCVPAGGRTMWCPRIYQPVCGRDGQTYGNSCALHVAGIGMAHPGRC